MLDLGADILLGPFPTDVVVRILAQFLSLHEPSCYGAQVVVAVLRSSKESTFRSPRKTLSQACLILP